MIEVLAINESVVLHMLDNVYEIPKEYKSLWIDVLNPTEEEIIMLNNRFNFHSLALEHLKENVKGSKFFHYGDYGFIALTSVKSTSLNKRISFTPIYFFISKDYLITIRYEESNIISKLKGTIMQNKDVVTKGLDYLLYIGFNEVIEDYFNLAEKLEEKTESIQDEIMDNPHEEILNEVMDLKRNVLRLKKRIYPLREILTNILREDYLYIPKKHKLYFSDASDHLSLVSNMLDSDKDMLISCLELYSSQVSNKTNNVMKFLTVITTIMMPITLISGIYGMNFTHMPELDYKYSYLGFWIIVIFSVIIQLIYFKKKKWL